MLATEARRSQRLLDVGAASAANNLADRDKFAAKAAPTFTVIQIKRPKQVLASVFSVAKYLLNQPTKSGEDPIYLTLIQAIPNARSRPLALARVSASS